MRQGALGAMAVLGLAMTALEAAEHAQLTLDRSTDPMRHVDDAARDRGIVLVIGRRLAVGLERSVHHHRGEAVLDRGQAGRFVIAVVLMHADRNVGIHQRRCLHHLRQHDVVGVGAGAARGLHDHRRVDGLRRLHDRDDLFHIVDVEGGNAVAVLGGMIEKLSQGNLGHHNPLGFTCDGSDRAGHEARVRDPGASFRRT